MQDQETINKQIPNLRSPEVQEVETGKENAEIVAIESNGLNLNYFNENDQTNHFFCESSCITPLDEKDKFTKGLYECVALVILGEVDGVQVSLLSHFNPKSIQDKKETENDPKFFEKELRLYLEQNCSGLEKSTCKIFVIGGKIDERFSKFGKESALSVLTGEDLYQTMKNTLTAISYEVFGKSPSFPCKPSTRFSADNEEEDTRVYIHTKEGEVYVVRKPQN